MPSNSFEWIWWVFSAIVVGFLINIASSYIKSLLDSYWIKLSGMRLDKSKMEQADIHYRIDYMLEDSLYSITEIFYFSRNMAFLIGIFLFILLIFLSVCVVILMTMSSILLGLTDPNDFYPIVTFSIAVFLVSLVVGALIFKSVFRDFRTSVRVIEGFRKRLKRQRPENHPLDIPFPEMPE